jgi:hypothetical protein
VLETKLLGAIIKDYGFDKGKIVFIENGSSTPIHFMCDTFGDNDTHAVRFTHSFKTKGKDPRALFKLRNELLFKRYGTEIIESHFGGGIMVDNVGEDRYSRLYSYQHWAAGLELHYDRYPTAREWSIHDLKFDGIAPRTRKQVAESSQEILGTKNKVVPIPDFKEIHTPNNDFQVVKRKKEKKPMRLKTLSTTSNQSNDKMDTTPDTVPIVLIPLPSATKASTATPMAFSNVARGGTISIAEPLSQDERVEDHERKHQVAAFNKSLDAELK